MSKYKCNACNTVVLSFFTADISGQSHKNCPRNGTWEQVHGEIVKGVLNVNGIDLYLETTQGNYKIQHSCVDMLEKNTGTLMMQNWVGLHAQGEIAKDEDIPKPRKKIFAGWISGGTLQLGVSPVEIEE